MIDKECADSATIKLLGAIPVNNASPPEQPEPKPKDVRAEEKPTPQSTFWRRARKIGKRVMWVCNVVVKVITTVNFVLSSYRRWRPRRACIA